MGIINQLAVASIPVYNAQGPDEGPKCIPLSLDFSGDTVSFLEGKELTDFKRISLIQTVFIDARAAGADFTMAIDGTQQTIEVKAKTQGYYPVAVPNPFRITFSCASGQVQVILFNVPIAPGQWATS